tara:strand:+ start:3571 stop:4173 length:603 start_codon:yes stop_codon:yes gene_type:complete
MKQLAKAVIEVMKEVRGMEKNSKVGTGGHSYNGTKDQDVKEVFNEAMSKNGLCMIPFDIQENTQVDRWEEESTWNGKTSIKQKQSVFTKAVVKYTLLHESGESTIVCGYGHGVDPQDKGAGKATTYAMKNALLYTFLTPVGKIDDAETTHSKEIAQPQVKQKLTDEQFKKTLLADSKQIQAVINKFDIDTDKLELLKAKL